MVVFGARSVVSVAVLLLLVVGRGRGMDEADMLGGGRVQVVRRVLWST